MYRVLIVEDEEPLRKNICKIIQWEQLGFELVCEAGDGQEALAYIEGHDIDVMITDICMPFMDGLELSKRARKLIPSAKILILTGYNEFDYAQQAIGLNVSHYLLKPITAEELKNILISIKEELDEAYSMKKNLLKLKQQVIESQGLLREKFLLNLIDGYVNEEKMLEKSEALKIRFDAKSYGVAVLQIENKKVVAVENFMMDHQLLEFAIFNVCKEALEKYGQDLIFFGKNDQLVVVFKNYESQEGAFEKQVMGILEEMLHFIKRIFGLDGTAGVGDFYPNMKDIHYAYQDALLSLEYQILYQKNKVILKSDVEQKSSFAHQKLDEVLKSLEYAIKVGENNKTVAYISYIFEMLKHANVQIRDFKTMLLKITTTILKAYNDLQSDGEDEIAIDFTVFNAVFQQQKIEEIKTYYIRLCEDLSKKISSKRQSEETNQIQKAYEFIAQNYHNPVLDVQDLCDHLHLSASYFSRIFKTESQETFVEYLTRIRMDKAKELLSHTEMKIFEISTEIGYEDPHYFSYNFRKQVGLTPSEYRKKRGTLDEKI